MKFRLPVKDGQAWVQTKVEARYVDKVDARGVHWWPQRPVPRPPGSGHQPQPSSTFTEWADWDAWVFIQQAKPKSMWPSVNWGGFKYAAAAFVICTAFALGAVWVHLTAPAFNCIVDQYTDAKDNRFISTDCGLGVTEESHRG